MTREEFIDGYLERSGILEWRTPDGYAYDGREAFALPCRCEEEGCDGWAMVRDEGVRWHLFQNTDMKIAEPMRLDTAQQGAALARDFLNK